MTRALVQTGEKARKGQRHRIATEARGGRPAPIPSEKGRRRRKPLRRTTFFSTPPHDFAAVIYVQKPSSVKIR
jgi:hypothetical protein